MMPSYGEAVQSNKSRPAASEKTGLLDFNYFDWEGFHAMRSLIFGATGFIGCNLAWTLAQLGDDLTLHHRPGASKKNLDGISHEEVICGLEDETVLAGAIHVCDRVFNVAGVTSTLARDADARQKVNVDAAARIARLARQAGVPLLHVSSVVTVGTPPRDRPADETMAFNREHDVYAMTKLLGEQAVLAEVARGLKAVIVCPGTVVGYRGMKPVQRANFLSIFQGKMKVYPSGGVCLTDIDDLIAGMLACLNKGVNGERYILGGHNIPYRDYFHTIAQATGGNPPGIALPGLLLPLAGRVLEWLYLAMGREPQITADIGDVVSRNMYYSSKKAEEQVGYRISDWREAIAKAALVVGEKVEGHEPG